MEGAGRAHVGIAANMFCTQCGNAMRVAPQHVRMTVSCPHCGTQVEPWRVLGPQFAPEGARLDMHPVYRPPAYYPELSGYSHRSKVVAGVLGILLGWCGAHRFYLGYTGVGIIQIVLTVITGGAAGIWGFVEGILCLTGNLRDVDGLPLRD